MIRKSLIIICSVLIFSTINAQETETKTGDDILKQVIDKVATIKSATYQLDKIERVKGKEISEILKIKLLLEPFKVYSFMVEPKEGMEVLYDSEWEKKKAIINTNSFPWVNVKFGPTSKTMRKDQHHTILDSGYGKIVSNIQYDKQKKAGKTISTLIGAGTVEGKSCYILEIVDNEFSYKTYFVGEGEDISMIANKLKVSDYMILEANRKVKFYDDVEAGQQIKVPSSYSKRMLMYVDVNELIPLKIEVYDDKGLFEQFLFKNVKLNVSFEENEFSEDFEDYDF